MNFKNFENKMLPKNVLERIERKTSKNEQNKICPKINMGTFFVQYI
jgi:hypothetical protein